MTGRLQSIPLGAILTNPKLQNRNVGMQKYKEHSDAKRYKEHINQLKRSIKSNGQQEPMKVVAAEEGGTYELAPDADRPHHVPKCFWLVDGHHRLEALKGTGATEALVEILPGLGFADALDASRLANPHTIQPLSAIERIENAWAAVNLERDTYRGMSVKDLAALLGISENTIKRFRDAIRQEGIENGKIDSNAPRDKLEYQLQTYWQRKSTWSRLSVITWSQFKKQRMEPNNRTSGAARRRIIKMGIVQTVFGVDGRYEDKDVADAIRELAQDVGRPDGIAFVLEKYKPKVSQPTSMEDSDTMEHNVDHHQLGMEVARLRAEDDTSMVARDT